MNPLVKFSTIVPGSVLGFDSLLQKPLEEQVQKIVINALLMDGVIKDFETLADPIGVQVGET